MCQSKSVSINAGLAACAYRQRGLSFYKLVTPSLSATYAASTHCRMVQTAKDNYKKHTSDCAASCLLKRHPLSPSLLPW